MGTVLVPTALVPSTGTARWSQVARDPERRAGADAQIQAVTEKTLELEFDGVAPGRHLEGASRTIELVRGADVFSIEVDLRFHRVHIEVDVTEVGSVRITGRVVRARRAVVRAEPEVRMEECVVEDVMVTGGMMTIGVIPVAAGCVAAAIASVVAAAIASGVAAAIASGVAAAIASGVAAAIASGVAAAIASGVAGSVATRVAAIVTT